MRDLGIGMTKDAHGRDSLDKAVLRRILKSNREAAYTELEKSNPTTEQINDRIAIYDSLADELKEKLSFLRDTIVHPEEALITIENFVKHANLALDRALHAKNIDEARVKDIDDKIHALKSLIILLRANYYISPTGETKLRAIEKLIEDALAQAELLLNGTHNAAVVDLMFRDKLTGENAQIHTFVSSDHDDPTKKAKLEEAQAKFDEICNSPSSVDGFNHRGEVSAGNAPTSNYYDQKMVC